MLRTIQLGKSDLHVPVLAVGCMRLTDLSKSEAERFIRSALEAGANFFDHADIYGGGRCEELFSEAIGMNDDIRQKIILQSKCGIVGGKKFDFSARHILNSVDGILRRLKTDYLDVLLLHRPDALVEPEELAETLNSLEESGKVRHFGISNHNPMQIELLRRYIQQPFVANQLQLGIAHASMITQGIYVNMLDDRAASRDGGILDYCRLHDITIQPWSPLQYGFFEGVFLGSEKYPELNKTIDKIADGYGVSNTTIAIAWLLRHPARMQPVTGTTKTGRLLEYIKAAEITLTRDEWYEILIAAGNALP